MMNLFDYIYYRIYTFFLKQRDNVPETKGSVLLTVLQCFSLLSVVALVKLVRDFSLPPKIYLVPFVVPIGVFNWYRYERNFDIEKYKARWSHELKSERRKKDWLIVTWFVLVILIPVSIGVLRHNLGLIK
ncbi:hypothetical protein LVD17_09920 [Fulvivirga ulvae]|uniref:hypothetical protein n=1 Tax=Fulvivirga ulvae TaxID=2904245 RepID=UPI001F15DA19|nr:hypothetical protein [Fulvivirga ulvae]UII34130.1 hypothetical protein LVD17_09920 [Fulvivirga ulvae]